MENLKPVLELAHQYLPADLWNKAVLALGYASLLGQLVPWLLAKGVPAAGAAADWCARTALNSPLRPLVLWLAPTIVRFLDSLTAALERIAETFRDRLEADLQAAAAAEKTKPSFAEGAEKKGGLNAPPDTPRPTSPPAAPPPA